MIAFVHKKDQLKADKYMQEVLRNQVLTVDVNDLRPVVDRETSCIAYEAESPVGKLSLGIYPRPDGGSTFEVWSHGRSRSGETE